ncbi:unnamed protein product [Brachionus calyciflorus]|uniref:Uncharacterized protein n=1 Tax=Brachionus calyciflorus TaxID=104777 RepID=A0A814HHK9_9BILA|nr:unnamed protein product [Brachionus calyciflorus]
MARQATGSFVREVIVRGLPNLYNIRDIFVRRVSSFIEEFNSENGRQLSTVGECRIPRTTDTRTHAFISIGDLFDNDWLINASDGARFEEHTLEAREYSRVEATVEIEHEGEELRQELALVNARNADLQRRLEETEERLAAMESEIREARTKLEVISNELI